jgi:hypothetical protein
MVGVDVTLEAFNKAGYLFKGFFHRKSPFAPLFLRGVKLALCPVGKRDAESKD